MSLLKSPPEVSAVQAPLEVRIEPYLVESICALARLVRDKGLQHSDISGLLFGGVDSKVRTVEALKTFVDAGTHSELARRERMDKAYKSALEEAKVDPELSSLDVVGWFSFRNGTGLLSSDISFHNQHFRKQEDLALIVWREGPSQITAELYSKSDDNVFTSDDYRWGSVRLSADIRHMREPVELSLRLKMSDDSYLRAYDTDEPQTQFSNLIRRAEAASDKFFDLFSKRKESASAPPVKGLIGQGRVFGLLGDGRLPDPSSWPPEAKESAAIPQTHFNPYAVSANHVSANHVKAATGGAFTAWPNADQPPVPQAASAAGPRPSPAPQYAPAAPSALDFSTVGQSPRSGRAAQTEIGGLPMVIRPREVKKASAWPWAAGLFVACSAAVFAFLSLGGLQSDGGRMGQAYHAMFPGGDLNMRVRNEDERLRLTWNQRNPAVASATDATLQIFDGQQHREVHLDGRQVADGSVLYRPVTNDVTFRLEVRGEQGGTSGSIRLLDGLAGQRAALDVSAPTAQSSSAAASNQPQLLGDASRAADAGSPNLLRPNAEGSADPYAASIVGGQLPPNTNPVVPPTQFRPVQRYETPRTIGTLTPLGGTTINSWDPSTLRSRAKQRTARAAKPAYLGAGYSAPRPLMQVMPRTSAIPAGTIQARTRVEVQVSVDLGGKVASAQVVSPGVNQILASSALAAARQWTFEPASSNGQRVAGDHTIVFEFRPER